MEIDPTYLFTLPLPPTSNHRLIPIVRHGRLRLITAPSMRKWKAEAASLLEPCDHFTTGKVRLDLTIVWPDRRKRDLDGPVKPVLDALTAAGVWGDDDQVKDLRLWVDDAGYLQEAGTIAGKVQTFVPF